MFQTNITLSELGPSSPQSINLSHLLQAAYQNRYNGKELQQTLDKYKESLSNPLFHQGPSRESAQLILNQQHNLSLSEQDQTLINKFCEATNLDQKYILCYLLDGRQQIAAQQQRELPFMNVPQNTSDQSKKLREFIKTAYFNARKLRLKALKELLVVYDYITPKHDESKMQEQVEQIHAEELRKIIHSAVEYLFSKNVITNLCKSIQSILKMKNSTFSEEYQAEICDCIVIIYSISQGVQCNVDDVKILLDLFKQIVMNKDYRKSHRMRACSYLLSLCLYGIMDPSDHSPFIDPRNGSKPGPNKVLDSGDELTTKLMTLQNEFVTINQNDRVHLCQVHAASFCLLTIGMLYKIKAKAAKSNFQTKNCAIALRHGALEGLYRDFLMNATLVEELSDVKDNIFASLSDYFCELFELCDQETRDTYSRERKALLERRHGQRRPRGLSTMLLCLIYLTRHSLAFGDMFITHDAGKSFIAFLDNTADVKTPWFHLYAKFIYELAQYRPQEVYLQITNEQCEKLTIDRIWQILEKTVQTFMPRQTTVPSSILNENLNASNVDNNPYPQIFGQQRMGNAMGIGQMEVVWQEPPEMTDMEIKMVCAVLKVLEGLGGIEDVQQQLNEQHRAPGIIELLFRLLRCSVPIKVMSQTIATLSSFVKNRPNQADKVWQCIERDQVLYTQRQKNQPITKGVELDIIEGEKDGNDAVYPQTVSFCRLLMNLLKTTAIPQTLGQGQRGQRPPGIHPYTDYIRDVVFLRWAKREYKSEREQWELAATCLQIFDALLDKFNPQVISPNSNIRYLFTVYPSFELLTLLLAPHSNVIEVILDIFQKAFNIMDDENQYSDDVKRFVKESLRNSLNLIQKAIDKEESFLNICQKYWPQRLSLRPLNTTLLSQQYREQIISMGKCIEHGYDPHVSSHALSILSHLNKTRQGITLRSVFSDQIQILQSSFSSQLLHYGAEPEMAASELPDIRVAIIQFLLKSIQISGHNLGLMLLGFSEQSAARDQLQTQISVLNALFQISLDVEFCLDSAAFAEGCFELLYRLLSSNRRIGERFFKAAENYHPSFFITLLRRNMDCVSTLPNPEADDQREIITCYLNQRAWLLRAISFEFHLMNSGQTNEILSATDVQYLGFINDGSTNPQECALWRVFEQFAIDIGGVKEINHISSFWGVNLDQFKIYANQQNEETFTWNIPKMYTTLQRAGLRQSVPDIQVCLQKVAQEALDHNLRVSLLSALDRAYDSWAQLIRCVLSDEIIGYQNMDNSLLLKLLDSTLVRLTERGREPAMARVSNILSQVALSIMHYFKSSLEKEFPVQISRGSCVSILKEMIEAVLMQNSDRNTRANLYSAISTYLHYCKFKIPNVLSDAEESKAINLNVKVTTEKEKFSLENAKALLFRKDELLNILFSDSVSKDPYLSSVSSLLLQKVLSANDNLGSLGTGLSNISPARIWLEMIKEKSRLVFILKGACDLDEHIQRALQSQRERYYLYQFEAMMDVLITASTYEDGAKELIDNNCILHLTELKSLTSRVFWTAYSSQSQQIPSLNGETNNLSMECARYLQLMIPCLRLMNAMFASCPKNVRLHYAALRFSERHKNIIDKLLTLDNNEYLVLRCIKLILSIWYQLYCGPLYIRDPNRISSISAGDSSVLEHIESKLPIFYHLIKKFKDIAFKTDLQNDIDNDFEIVNDAAVYDQEIMKPESKERIGREIIRILLNIFRLKSIGSSVLSSISDSGLRFNAVFGKELTSSNRSNEEEPPNLYLLCECLKGLLPISQQTGRWIAEQNEELRRIAPNDNTSLVAKIRHIEPMLSVVSQDVNLQCYLIENILILLYFHCEFYLKSFAQDFYHRFSSVVIDEAIHALEEWYNEDQTCILHVNQDMIKKKWSSGVDIPDLTKTFIEILITKFKYLHRDNRSLLSIAQQ